ncbi:MAG: amino acid ABC transporter permease [Thiomicrorhabdus sp.]|jgi:polar amino acid transport system permease protein|nr:amino acid ABC transporter permease [Thiomicrorhabdus sp.]
MIYETLWGELPYLMEGVLIVIELLILLLLLGLVVGMLLASMEVYGNKFFKMFAKLFISIFRGVPAVILLFLVYYGISNLYDIPSFGAAVLALGLRSAAYQSQIFRGAIESIPEGQMKAAYAIGMSKVIAFIYIILPQALRLSIGPWSNEFSSELKATSLAYLVGVVELLRRGKYIVSYTYGNALVVYVFCGIIYFILTAIGNNLLYRLEIRLSVPGFERRDIRDSSIKG